MTHRASWLPCILVGVLTLLMAMLVFPMFPADAAGPIEPHTLPIYAFEFARTPADLLAVFGEPGDPDRARRLEMMDRGNRWDFLFMSLYTAFGALFGLAAHRSGLSWGRLVIAAALIAGLADAAETSLLLSISGQLAANGAQDAALAWLWLPVLVKFALIGLTIGAAGVCLFKSGSKPWQVIGAAAILLGAVSAAFGFRLSLPGLDVGTAIGLGWIAMIAYAATRIVRGPIPPRPQHR